MIVWGSNFLVVIAAKKKFEIWKQDIFYGSVKLKNPHYQIMEAAEKTLWIQWNWIQSSMNLI